MEKQIARIEVKLEQVEKEILYIKECLKKEYGSKENQDELKERITKIEINLSKLVWIVLTAVITAILYLVIRT